MFCEEKGVFYVLKSQLLLFNKIVKYSILVLQYFKKKGGKK